MRASHGPLFGGTGAAPRMRRSIVFPHFCVFHEHVLLCVKNMNAHTTVRSAAPKKRSKTAFCRKTLYYGHMNRDKKKQNVNSPRHGEVKQASGCHGVLRWAQIVFFPYTTDMTRHTSPKRFLQQKNEKTRFYKSLQRAPQKKVGKINFVF